MRAVESPSGGDVQESKYHTKLDSRRLLYDHPRHIAVRDALGLSEHVLSVPSIAKGRTLPKNLVTLNAKNSTCKLCEIYPINKVFFYASTLALEILV